MTIAFKSQFSFIEGGHVFASNLKNKTKQKKKPKKETIKRFSLRKKKTKQQQQQKPEYCRFIAVSWFRCFYDDRYSGGGVVEKSNSDSVRRKTVHTLIPRWTL